MRYIILTVLGHLVVFGAGIARAEPAKRDAVVVLPLKGDRIVPGALAALSDLLVVAVEESSGFDVVTKVDIEARLDQEAMKEFLG